MGAGEGGDDSLVLRKTHQGGSAHHLAGLRSRRWGQQRGELLLGERRFHETRPRTGPAKPFSMLPIPLEY